MALAQLSASGDCPLRVFISDALGGQSLNKAFGQVSVPALDILLDFGTGSAQANKLYIAKRTLAATTYDDLDMSGTALDVGVGLANVFSITVLKLAVVAIVTPDGTKKLRVGPQGRAAAFAAPYGGVGVTVYKEVTRWDVPVWESVAGYAVANAATDVFPIYNPTASSIDYWVLLCGI